MIDKDFAKKMMDFQSLYDAKIAELVGHVNDALLDKEEAAQSMAGWMLKNSPTHPINKHESHDDLLKRCRVEIDTRLPDFSGLTDRHI